jgi:DNA-binding XRE family transcriptional regulator
MKNPVQTVRERLQLSRMQLALLAGISYEEVWKCEAGYRGSLHARLAECLTEQGYVGDPCDDYLSWRQELSRQLRDGRPEEAQ